MSGRTQRQRALRDHHRRRRPGRPDGGALRRPLAHPDARARARRPRRRALEHGRGRGLPRLRAHHGTGARGQDPEARREVRRHVRDRRGRRRSRSTATTASCTTADGREFRAPAVIVVAGGEPRKLGVPGEEELAGKGVSYCAVCDGAFFEGEEIAVVGGGDSAVEEGTFLTRYGRKVHLIHRRDGYRAQPILVEQMRATGKVDEILNTRRRGDPRRRRPRLAPDAPQRRHRRALASSRSARSSRSSASSRTRTSSTTRSPSRSSSTSRVTSSPNDTMETAVPGIFAAGDVRSQFVRQITNAVGDATTAALAAHAYVERLKHARVEAAACSAALRAGRSGSRGSRCARGPWHAR